MSLSRRSLIIFSVIILLAILGIWTGQPLQGVWRWPTALILCLMVWERIQLNLHFIVAREIPAKVSLGEKTTIRQSVCNHGLRKLSYESQAHYPEAIQGEPLLQHWTIAKGGKQVREFSIIPVSLGETTLGQLYGRILGQFGLVWWTHNIKQTNTFTVEPALLTHDKTLSGQVRSGGRKTHYKPGSGFELLTIRDYQYGDSQRSIDWKASARRQKPMVRIFSQEQRLELVILLDCGRGSYIQCDLMDRLHHYVNAASRLTDFAIRHDDHVACIAYADQIINSVAMSGGIASVKKIRQLLGGLSVVADESNPLAVALELKRYLKRRSLVIFLTEIEQAEASTQLIQAVQLLRTKHHIMIASINDPNISNLIYNKQQGWLEPYQKLAASEYLRGRELTTHKLQKSGVSCITASAEQLDSEVLSYYQKLHDRREL